MPLSRRRVLAGELEDERFADLLEELSEDEQVKLVEGLDHDRLGRVLDEMEADDAADLLGEFSASRQAELLRAMDPEEAEPVRRLLTYQPDTAGGLMTPEPVILAPAATVAEALARVRDPDLPVRWRPRCSSAGRRWRRRPAAIWATSGSSGCCARRRASRSGAAWTRTWSRSTSGVSDREVAGRLAAYDVVALAVIDDAGRLVGAVTIDDVLDRVLPANWRVTLAGADGPRRRSRASPRGTPGGPVYDPDAFGRLAERLARFLGTGRYLVGQTVFVLVWITLNVLGGRLRWDQYPFILLNLVFSTQAAYAAPLILLAQNRQADRDKDEVERDREVNARSLAETEFLAREIAAVRLAVEQKADRDDMVEPLERLNALVDRLEAVGALGAPDDED